MWFVAIIPLCTHICGKCVVVIEPNMCELLVFNISNKFKTIIKVTTWDLSEWKNVDPNKLQLRAPKKISHRNSRVDCELVCTPCTWRSNTAKDMKRTSLYWTTDVSSWAHDMSIISSLTLCCEESAILAPPLLNFTTHTTTNSPCIANNFGDLRRKWLLKRFLQEVAFIETTIGNWVFINFTHTWLVQGEKENNEYWKWGGGGGVF
jgi:hypothetical protein